ncbi:ribosome maturation factor RimM [Maricaulis sp.]|uniref:ribosome maturation factor RimM n=1 Tax=Maricaulis sp. TaxID=1486257 RepID=UPI000C4F8E33|nr:ribosome maturation factor RimM [Maricaulis sp.]MAC89485.1 16S rRNA processing protein RimM [Maricaulis sp.]
MTTPADDLVFIAAIAGAHGVRGECKVKSFAGNPADAFKYGAFLDIDGKTVLTPKAARPVKDGFVVRFAEQLDRDKAQALKGTKLHVLRSALPKLEEDEFYHSDLLGLRVQGLDGAPMGTLKAVHDFGSGDLLEITGTPDRNGSWMLPFTREFVPHVSIADGVVTIDPPEDVGSKAEEEGGGASDD